MFVAVLALRLGLSVEPLPTALQRIAHGFNRSMQEQEDHVVATVVGIALVLALAIYLGRRYYATWQQRDEEHWRGVLFSEAVDEELPMSSGEKRQWVRVPGDVLDARVMKGERASDNPKSLLTEQLLDISGGGLSFVSGDPVEKGAQVVVELHVEPKKRLTVRGQVAGVRPSGEEGRSIVGVRLIGVLRQDQDKIVRWVIERQRELIEEHRRIAAGCCIRCGRAVRGASTTEPSHCAQCLAKLAGQREVEAFRRRSMRPSRPPTP